MPLSTASSGNATTITTTIPARILSTIMSSFLCGFGQGNREIVDRISMHSYAAPNPQRAEIGSQP